MVLKALWDSLRLLLGALGALLGALGPLFGAKGSPLSALGSLLEPLGASWALSWGLLGPLLKPLGLSLGHPGFIRDPSGIHPGSILEALGTKLLYGHLKSAKSKKNCWCFKVFGGGLGT